MAEHELNKIVDDDGEVFNLRDSTKQPTADRVTAWGSTPSDTKYPSEKLVKNALDGKLPLYKLGSEVPSSQDFVCLRIKANYVSGVNKSQVLLYDITSFADGTIVENDSAYVGFEGFLIGGKPQGSGEVICVKICAKVAYSQITTSTSFRTLKSDSSTCGPEIIKRTEDGVDKYYLSIFYDSTLYSGNDVLVGQFRWRAPSGISVYSYQNGVIGEYTPNQTYPANEPLWDRLQTWTSNIHANTSTKLAIARKLKTNLARTADSTFDGSADQTNIPVTGTLPIANGGTGKTTAKAAEYNLTTGKSEISDTTSGDDRVVFELASPSESNGVTRGFRKLSTIWTWIKGQISSVLGLSESGYSGNAATASAAQSGSALETAINGKMNTSASNATAPSGSGGDGATATLLNNLTDGNSDIVTTDDGDNVLIATTDNGGSVTNKWYKRKLVKLIPWIIKKLGTRLVYDCGAGSTSGDDFDAALAAFNAGQWVIIHKDGNVYYCVGTFQSSLRFRKLSNSGTGISVSTLNWTRENAPTSLTQLDASLSNHTHSQYLTASSITGKMNTDAGNAASGALQNLTAQLTEGTSDFTDNTEIFTSYAGNSGFAEAGHVNQPYRRKASSMLNYIANSGLAQLVQIYGNSAKKLEIGYATIADSGNSSEMKALVELTCVSQSSTSQPGSSILMLVSVSCTNTYRFTKATILENTFWDGRTRPVIVTKVVSNRMYVYVGLLANNGTSLVSFDYTYAKITRIGCVNNWSWEHEYTSDGTFDYIFYCDDSVKFVPTVNSNTIGTTAGISSNSPADACVTYWTAMQPGCIRMVYNQNGTEYTLLFSKSSDGKYGSILKWSYTDNYMRIIRIQNNSVLTGADWVKISAGYADSAGSLSSSVSVGSANQPVYFNNGVPTACNWWVS